MILKYIKTNLDNYINVRQVMKQEFNISSKLALKLKTSNNILLNNLPIYLDATIKENDEITFLIDFVEDNSNIIANKMPLDILFEDDSLLIVNKPAGVPVHPSMDHYEDSLSNGIKYYFDTLNLHKKIRPVNRLDKNTSGIVIFAKNEYIQELLSQQMNNRLFQKEYIAICEGTFPELNGTINAPIARKKDSIIERCIDPFGANSITHYTVVKTFNNMSQLLIKLETGRTHQIRVHLASINHPIIGDSLYGNTSPLITRQALHAYKIQFLHPMTKEPLNLKAELPKDMQSLI